MVEDEKILSLKYLNEGILLENKKHHKEAFEYYMKAHYYASNNSHNIVLLTSILERMGSIVEYIENDDYFNEYSINVSYFEHLVQSSRYYKQHLALILSIYASSLYKRDKVLPAKSCYEKVNILYRELFKANPKSIHICSKTILNLNNTGKLLADMNLYNEAEWKFEKAIYILENKSIVNHTYTLDQKTSILENIGDLHREIGNFGKAKDIYNRIIQIFSSFTVKELSHEIRNANVMSKLAEIFIATNQKKQGLIIFESLIPLYSNLAKNYPDNNQIKLHNAVMLGSLAHLLQSMNRPTECMDILNKSFTIFNNLDQRSLVPEDYNSLIALLFNYSYILIGENKISESLQKFYQGVDLLTFDGIQSYDLFDMAYKCLIYIFNKTPRENSKINEKILEIYNILNKIVTDSQTASDEHLSIQNLNKLKTMNSEINNVFRSAVDDDNYIFKTAINNKVISEEEGISNNINILDKQEIVMVQDEDIKNNVDITVKLGDAPIKKGICEQTFNYYIDLYSTDKSKKELLYKASNILKDFETELHFNKKENDIKCIQFLAKGYDILIKNDVLNADYHYNLAVISKKLGNILLQIGCTEEARIKYENSIDAYFSFINISGNKYHLKEIFEILQHLESNLSTIENKEEKLIYQIKITESYDLMYHLDSKDISLLEKLATSQQINALFFSELGRNNEAHKFLIASLENYKYLYTLEPSSKNHMKVAVSLNNIGTIFARMEQKEKAKSFMESALRIYSHLFEENPNDIESMLHSTCTLDNMGTLFSNMDRLEDSKKMYEFALKMFINITDINQEILYEDQVSSIMDNIGHVLEKMGRDTDAKWMYANAKKIKNREV